MLNINLKGKTALVTGGSRGVGAAIVEILASAGANVVVNYIGNDSEISDLKDKLAKYDVKALFINADVTDKIQVRKMAEIIMDMFGVLDILVNNAGITYMKNINDLTIEDVEKVYEVNVKGVFNTVLEHKNLLSLSDSASIVNIGSTSMYTGGGGGAHYSSTKSALIGITRTLSKELAPKGIRTNLLGLSLIKTEMMDQTTPDEIKKEKLKSIPLGRFGLPEDVGYLVAFLSSDLGSYINGEIIALDGGRTFS
jgi:3-oxoacyl-[acyl-carrier protein] reductase